jgi:hypothetical protein
MTPLKSLAFVLAIAGSSAPALAADAPAYGYRTQTYERTVVSDHSKDPAYVRPYSGVLPVCHDPSIHGQIASSFAAREREYWHSGLVLSSAFYHPVELGYRSWGHSFIPRRFCEATAATNDGVTRKVFWLVAEKQGAFSTAPGIDWCVTGLDRNRTYAPDCKMEQP